MRKNSPEPAALPVPELAGTPLHCEPDSLPGGSGAYILLIELDQPIAVAIGGRNRQLAAGRYLYCGSARGPGGIKARVSRHMRQEKTIRWHVDQLTTAGRVVGVWAFPGGDECDLVAALDGLPVPVRGFGSSDCRQCASHLLAWP